ncbi:Type I acyl-CoA thioesterase [Fulvia fulva]|uniref:Type I acyl-CoA thioesterase n=1 Tax=Passalora fulva TaxID=5499 RepID=A0A9Q8UV00_PASFU|nr:Type I acyl-CoA thioesterase [Fulvia fulva]UJO23410.1 Type I acyl-CoA thioesterase [Fulvia fulva]WPV36022.1 Type I acyl-CoA thioesterase [Fulvia fulva]
MAGPFVIREHTFEGQHIREYPRALASNQEDVVWLHAKSYTPHEVDNGSAAGDMTIIAYHANAIQKKAYEPFFETLYRNLKERQGLVPSSIWIADQAAQGTSALLSDETLGNDPSWFDHSRDVLAMTNTFRKHIKKSLVAIGHSMGGVQAIGTSHLHPNLFDAVVMMDSPISLNYSPSLGAMVNYALGRVETYDTREQAEQAIRKSPVFEGWSKQALQRHIETAFHDSPTVAIPNRKIKPTNTKHAEITSLTRPNVGHMGVSGELSDAQRAVHPDVDPKAPLTGPVYNPYPRQAWNLLPSLRPCALFVCGEGSRVCRTNEIEERQNLTGTAPGGSGGAAVGKVASVTVPGGHFMPMTNMDGTAEAIASWLRVEVDRYLKRRNEVVGTWMRKDLPEKQKLDVGVEKTLRSWDGKPWAKPEPRVQKSRL